MRLCWFLTITLLGACSPYAPDLGAQPFYCGPAEPKCPDGYTCTTQGVCATMAGSAGVDSGIDSGGSGTCAQAFSGVLATWSLVGEPGTQASTAAMASAPGVTAMPLSRAPAPTAASGTDSISGSDWPVTAQLDTLKYYAFGLGGPSGCALDVTSLAIDVKSSGTGPTSASAATSDDGFNHATSVSTSAPSTPALAVTNATGALEIRIYGFSATASGGTMRVENTLTVTGSLH